jgi:hypothetical protein
MLKSDLDLFLIRAAKELEIEGVIGEEKYPFSCLRENRQMLYSLTGG